MIPGPPSTRSVPANAEGYLKGNTRRARHGDRLVLFQCGLPVLRGMHVGSMHVDKLSACTTLTLASG